MYVASKGGEKAIAAAHEELARARRGDPAIAELSLAQIREQLSLAVARVMAEGSLYDPDLAALAIKQARGDLIEAIFLLRAYRATLPRFGASDPIDTAAMRIERRISATYKDVPGGQILGPTFDYSHRLLDFALAAESPLAGGASPEEGGGEGASRDVEELQSEESGPAETETETAPPAGAAKVLSFLGAEGLMEPARKNPASKNPICENGAPEDPEPGDLTREPMDFPANRDVRLQALARADEGFLLGLAYSTQRGYARSHAFVGELRIGQVGLALEIPELGFAVEIGELQVTECETVNQFKGSKTEPPQFTRGYGLVFGQSERKALSMALVDRALRWEELGEDYAGFPAQDAEFVLPHGDNIQATGFLEHIKLPHYVDFQSELTLVRKMRAEIAERRRAAAETPPEASGESAEQ